MPNLSRGAAAVLVVSTIAAGGAYTVTPAGAARTKAVSIEDIDFSPGKARVSRGDTVRWTWKDGSTPHNVRSRGSKRFTGSGTKSKGTHSVRFTRRGTYRYVCTIHLGMDGSVVVSSSADPNSDTGR